MIRQRILYVGIGGSGLDIGRELVGALTKEVCGLDERRLKDRGGAFAGFERGQLPKFIQSVYLDFSQAALDEIKTHLRGKNATAIHTILPPFGSSKEAEMFLKNQKVPQVHEWIPDDPTVNVAPLSGGAGQYPTVGRTALFASLKKQGYAQTIGTDLGRVLDELAQSRGQLEAFVGNGAHTESIAVYLGFSLSGGTGCGIFYDVIHLLYNELITRFPNVPCLIMPIVIMPSLFDNVLVGANKRNTQLNAATALLDLSRLMDLFNNPDPELAAMRVVQYPWTSVNGAGGFKAINLDTQFGKTAVKVATLVDRRGGLDRKDVYRSIASAIVSQVSTVANVNQQVMGFVDKLVNDNEIRDMHHTLLGRKNIMPTVSASLTLPADRLVGVISQRLLADGLKAQSEAVVSRGVSEEYVNSFLKGSGQGRIVEAHRFNDRIDITFAVSAGALADGKKYEQFKGNMQRKVVQSLGDLTPIIKQAIPEMIDIRTIDGLIGVLDTYEDRNIYDALAVGSRALGALRNQRFVDEVGPKKGKKKSKWSVPFFGRKPDRAGADRWVKLQEEQYVVDVKALWWTQWDSLRIRWQGSADASDHLIELMRDLLNNQVVAANRAWDKEITQLGQKTLGIAEYLPSVKGNMEQTLANLTNEVKVKIRERYGISEADDGTLLSKVMRADQRNAWADALKTNPESDEGMFMDGILEPMRSAVRDVLQYVLKPLGDSLSELAHAQTGALSPELDQLQAKLGSLLPDGVIPQIHGAKPRVLVTYPGDEDKVVEEYLRTKIFGSRFEEFATDHAVFQFAAATDSPSITATVNIVGQGLLDSEEVRSLLATWVEANKPDKPQPVSDRLAYRQRISTRNLQDITDSPNRKVILRNFLAALYDGHVTITKGTVERPEVIRITVPGTDAHLDISLESQHGASPWASLFNGFEEKIVTSSSLTRTGLSDAIKWFGEYIPACLLVQGEVKSPAPLFESIVDLVVWHGQNPPEQENSVGMTKSALLKHESVRRFWTREIPESLTAPYFCSPERTYWCIGQPYSLTGKSGVMKEGLKTVISQRSATIEQMMADDRERREAIRSSLS